MSFLERTNTCVHCKQYANKPPKHPALGDPLTRRESQITQGISEAKRNKQIAYDLHITEGTVKVYVSNIFVKAGVENRTGLAAWWIRKSEIK